MYKVGETLYFCVYRLMDTYLDHYNEDELIVFDL